MAKFAALALLACVLAASASAACVGSLVTTGCKCTAAGVGPKCKGALLCQPVDILGLVKSDVCVLPNVLPPVCAAVAGLGLPIGCKCLGSDLVTLGQCIIPTVTGVVAPVLGGLPLVGSVTGLLTGLVGSVVGTALSTVGTVLPVLPTAGSVVPLLTGTVCDATKLLNIPFGCPCSAAKPCMAGAKCLKKVTVDGVVTVTLAQALCLPPLPLV